MKHPSKNKTKKGYYKSSKGPDLNKRLYNDYNKYFANALALQIVFTPKSLEQYKLISEKVDKKITLTGLIEIRSFYRTLLKMHKKKLIDLEEAITYVRHNLNKLRYLKSL